MRRMAAALFVACAVAYAGIDAPPPYVLGPGDQITIQAIDAEELAGKPFTIDASGVVTLPLLGRVPASGRTVLQFENDLTERLRDYFVNPSPSVSVTEYHSQPVSVSGALNTPGIQQLRGQKTLIEILSMAGGLRPDAGSQVTIQREVSRGPIPLPGAKLDGTGRFFVGEVNLREVIDNSHPERNIVLQPNDIVSVPRADLVYVVGEVKKAGGFPLNERQSISVLQALSLAEGPLPDAAPSAGRILRGSGRKAEREEIAIDVKKILSGKTPDVLLRPDDILFIPSSTGKKVAMRGVEAAIQLGTGLLIWK